MRWWSWMWFKQGQIEVECGDENGYGSCECGNEGGVGIAGKLKSIAHIINNSLDSYDYNVVADDNSTNETNDDLLL